jgi:N-methylhydantoinase A/oxoprolinase/acetone carboxylase beta subunit
MAEKLHTELIIPPYAEVANAIGAATGKIMETVKVLIKPGEAGSGYLMHAPWERKVFEELEEAVNYSLKEAKARAALAAAKAGAKNYELVIDHKDIYANASMIEKDVYVESRIEVTAVGRPEWRKGEEKEGFFVFETYGS